MATRFDHSQDDKITFETSDSVKVFSTFDQMGIREDLLRGIYAYSKFFFQFETWLFESLSKAICCHWVPER
jgi:hypothetical protein